MNCSFCGKITKNKFCNEICLNKQEAFNNKPFKTFSTLNEASIYFGMDVRKIIKYKGIKFEIIKQNLKDKCIDCKIVCNKSDLSRYSKRCKECILQNKHKIAQGEKISLMYKGLNNPNYIDGKSIERNLIRGKSKYKKFTKENKKDYCEITGFKENLELHHILPISIFPEFTYSTWNIITICSNLHYEIHKQKLDINFINNLNDLSNIKNNFINCVNINIDKSIKIDHLSFVKILVKNYNNYINKEKIDFIYNLAKN